MDARPIPIETLLAHRAWVRSVARAVVSDPNAADDVEQDAWVAALSSPPRDESSLRGWFRVVVRNRARRAGRSASRIERRETAAARDEATPSAADLAEIADTHRRVVQAVVELEEPYRQTILLRYFEGLAVPDVAARTGVPLDTARSRIARGLAKLRERLARELGTQERPWALALAPLIRAGGEPAAGAGVGAAATGGTFVATKTAWASAAALVVIGLGALVATKWSASADESNVVAAAAARPVAPAHAARTTAAAATPTERAPAPEPAEPEPAAPTQTAQQKLDGTWITGEWREVEFLDVMGDLSAQADVEFFIAAEALAALASGDRNRRVTLDFDHAPAAGTLGTLAEMQGLVANVEETRVVILPAGGERDASKPLVKVARRGDDPKAPQSLTVEGVVVDERGGLVARASLVGQSKDGDRSALAETDADGAFSLELTRPYPDVFATAAGRVPSRACALVGDYGTVVELRFALAGRAAVLEGRVLGADERPVAGARVVVTAAVASPDAVDPPRVCGPVGITWHAPVAEPLTTDADGRFRDDAVAPGEWKLTATAEGFASGSVTVEAKPSQTVHVDVRLGRTQCWRGTLRDKDGRPLGNALIQAWSSGAKANLQTTTAEDGTFAVAGIRAGSLHVRIETFLGRRMERLRNVEGPADLLWDPVIGSGMRIAGRVVDDKGAGVICTVKLIPSPSWLPAADDVTTEADGRFAFDDVDVGSYRVAARAPVALVTLPLALSPPISASDDDVVLRATATARVVGRLVDAAGRPQVSTMTIERVETGNQMRALVGEDGAFSAGPVPRGRYRFWFRSERDIALFDAGVHEVGETDLDLGAVAPPPSGRVMLRWTAVDLAADALDDELRWDLDYLPQDGARRDVALGRGTVEDTGRLLTLLPGRYAVRMSGASIQGAERSVEVRAGVLSAVEVPIRAAAPRRIALRFPGPAPLAARVHVSDAAGGRVHETIWNGDEVSVPLGAGAFRVQVDVTDTQTLTGEWDVPAAAAPAKFDVVLR